MPNSIADPLVENVISSDLQGVVTIDATRDGAVVISLAGPGNALDVEVSGALREAFETLHAADHARVVFVRGFGGSFFSGSLDDWARIAATDWTDGDLRDAALSVAHMLHAVTKIPALTVALVEGEATGVAAGLVAACDMAIAASDARFAFAEVRSGAVPAMAAPYVVNAIGPRQAKALFMTGRFFDAAYALQIGLVQQIADGTDMETIIHRVIEAALGNGPQAMHDAKRLVWEVWGRPLDRALMEDTATRFARSRFSDEGREGLGAMIEGRAPAWANAPV
jgi:methylglutaconyl-CoA hydratase